MPERYFNLTLKAWRSIRCRHDLPIATGTAIRYQLLASTLSLAQKTAPKLRSREPLKDPVFVIGHWRSGTTFLHEILAASGHFSFPTAYACMQPQAFLSRPLMPAHAVSKKRPMDEMMVSPSSAMEEEFALLGLGLRSAYEAFLIPEAITSIRASCDPEGWLQQETEEWTQGFRDFLAACQLVGSGRRLVLKSPTHIFRLGFLDRLFPRASYLYIERKPEDVFSSTLAMWRAMWELYAITPSPDPQVVEDAVLDTMAAARQLSRGFAKKHPDRFHTICFDDLVADPLKAISRAGEVLSIADLCNNRVISRVASIGDFTRKERILSESQKKKLQVRFYS